MNEDHGRSEQERRLDDAIEAALGRHFAPPAGLGEVLPHDLGDRVAAGPAGGRPARAGRMLPFSRMQLQASVGLAAALLVAVGAAFWFGWFDAASSQDEARPTSIAGLVPAAFEPSSCRLDHVFDEAAATDFEPRTGYKVSDARLLDGLESAPCEALVVLGEWSDPSLDAANIVMLRSGAEPVMLLVPKRDESPSDICLAAESSLNLYSGCFNGRPIYELSNLRESRVLACVDAERLELR